MWLLVSIASAVDLTVCDFGCDVTSVEAAFTQLEGLQGPHQIELQNVEEED